MSCLIDQEQIYVCGSPPIAGVDDIVYEYMHTEWRSMINAGLVTVDGDGMITDIVNAQDVKLYRKDVPPDSLVLGHANVVNAGAYPTFDHKVNYPLINNKQSEKNTVQNMTIEGRVIIIVKKSGEAELYGSEQGLFLLNTPANAADGILGGIIPVELGSPTAKETKMSKSVFKTDLATTLAMLEGLRVAGV